MRGDLSKGEYFDALVGVERELSVSRELARLEGGVGDSGVLRFFLMPRRLSISLNDSSSDSSSTSDLARESKNMSIIALTGLANRALRGFLGEHRGERNGGRERFMAVPSERKGTRSASSGGTPTGEGLVLTV